MATTTAKKTKKTSGSANKKTPAKSNAAKGLADLLKDGLKDIYWAEKALVKALPKMQKNASDQKLKKAIENHLSETEGHVERLENCFEALGMKPQAKKCDAMAGLIEEGESIVKETEVGAVRDAGIIMASQKIEHYEIASYGTLATFAKVLNEKNCLDNFKKTLGEEKKCDEKLSEIAENAINSQAK